MTVTLGLPSMYGLLRVIEMQLQIRLGAQSVSSLWIIFILHAPLEFQQLKDRYHKLKNYGIGGN
jgi:hypothetical protein